MRGAPRLYLDACCLNRPFDDQSQHRIRIEAAAVLVVLSLAEAGEVRWVGSEVLQLEIDLNPDPVRRARVALLAGRAAEVVRVTDRERSRARRLVGAGFGTYDALHLACAESSPADVFLTTDDRLVRKAASPEVEVGVRVCNPVRWVEEVLL